MAEIENGRPDGTETYESRAARRKRRQVMDMNASASGVPTQSGANAGSDRPDPDAEIKTHGGGSAVNARNERIHSEGASADAARKMAAGSDLTHGKRPTDHAGSNKAKNKSSRKSAAGRTRVAHKKSTGRKHKSFIQLMKESWFYRVYFILLLACAVALVFGLIQLWGLAKEYEETQPIHSAEPYLTLFEQRDWDALQAVDVSAEALKYETGDLYAQQMDTLLSGGEFSLKSIVTIDEHERQYNLLLDGRKIGQLTLEHSGEFTKHGMERWQLKRLETQVLTLQEYTVIVPADSTVTVSGRALGDADILERDIPVVDSNNLPDGVPAPTLVRYGVHMLSASADDIAVTDRNGDTRAPEQDGEYGFRCDLAWDDAQIKAQVEGEVVKWGRRLAAYTSNDYDKIDLSNACVNPSPARTYIRNMENQWAPDHNGYDFQNIATSEYYIYAGNCFSCRMSFDYILHYPSEDRSYPTAYTLYFAKDGSRFKLYSFTIDASQNDDEDIKQTGDE